MTSLWLDGYESAVHKALHVANRVECRNLFFDISLFVVEQLNGVGQIQVVIDRILITIELALQYFIIRCLLGQILDKVWNLYVTLVLPRVSRSPVRVEGLLNLLHLLYCSLFGILLHACIERGVNLQTLSVVGIFLVFAVVVGAPAFHPVGHSLTEVVGLAVVCILNAVVELDLQLLQRVALLLSKIAVLAHQIEHDVTTFQRILRVDKRVVICGGLQHSYQHSSLLCGKLLWRATKVGLTSSLNTKCVRTEVDGVGILGKNLVLGEEELQLVGRYPLLTLQYEHFDARNIAQQSCRIFRTSTEQVLGQLLGDGRCTTCIMMQGIVLQCCSECLIVDTMMAVETLVLCINQRLPEGRIHILVTHRGTVLTEELTYLLAIGTINHRCLGWALVLDGRHGWRLTKQPQEVNVYCSQIQEEGYHHCSNSR